MGKLFNLLTETTVSLSDYLLKIKSAGGGDVKVPIQNFINFLGANGSNPYKFNAYLSTGAAGYLAVASTYYKIKFDTKYFDTGSNYDNTTNFRFTAPVAGFYQVNASVSINNGSNSLAGYAALYKNGSIYYATSVIATSSNSNCYPSFGFPIQLAANDYLEVWAASSIAGIGVASGNDTFFSAYLISAT